LDERSYYNLKLFLNSNATRIMIEVTNLHKSFGDAHVLKRITTTFEKGKTNLIIGQSGSGKTVFWSLPCCVFVPDHLNACQNTESSFFF